MFLVYYRNGSSKSELDFGRDWLLVPDPSNVTAIEYRLPANENIRYILKGSSKYRYPFFLYWGGYSGIALGTGAIFTSLYTDVTMGFIVDKEGHCVCMEIDNRNGQAKTYYTTTKSLTLDLSKYKIDLNTVGELIESST